MIIFLYGKDTFRSLAHARKMIDKFKRDRDPSGLNVSRIDCEREEQTRIVEDIHAAPFLAEKRMVVLENFLISKHVALRETLLDLIEKQNVPKTTVLMFWEGTDTFKTKEQKIFFEQLLKQKYTQKFDHLTGGERIAWIQEEIAARGSTIDENALHFFSLHAGNDTWQLKNLLDQILAYTIDTSLSSRQRQITLNDVLLFIDERVSDNIFALVEAIVRGDAQQAFAMMREQHKEGKEPGYIFAMITRQFRILLLLRDMTNRDHTAQSAILAKKLALHPFVVKKSLLLLTRYTMDDLKKIYHELLIMDIKTKTGQGDERALLDVFVDRRAFFEKK